MSDSNTKPSNQNGNNKLIILVIVLLVVVIVLVAVLAFSLGRKQSSDSSDTSANTANSRTVADSTRVIVDEETAASVVDEMREQVEEGMFECSMSMTWTFEDGAAESKDAIVRNSENNTHPIYFDVTLKDTGELIYSSPVIPVGSQITNIALEKDLEPGTYKAIVMYSLLEDEESQVVTSQAGFGITIKVNN